MKTLSEILKQKPIFLHDWKDKNDLIEDFEIKNKETRNLENLNILFASYNYENYSGEAWVLFEQNGKLYEVNGSHCSCYGLEGQWNPEETTLEELKYRLVKGTFGEDDWSYNNFRKELLVFLGIGDDDLLIK